MRGIYMYSEQSERFSNLFLRVQVLHNTLNIMLKFSGVFVYSG